MGTNLLMHCNGREIDRSELEILPAPTGTRTHYPIPHATLLHEFETALDFFGWTAKDEQYGVSADGARFFGLMTLSSPRTEYEMVVGLRNSHDKTFPAGLVTGSRVFVCDNLAFSGEVNIARRHTRYIMRDLPRMVHRMVSRIRSSYDTQDAQIAAYQTHELDDNRAKALILEGVRRDVIRARDAIPVLNQWEASEHVEFSNRNVWSLFNAVTEVAKTWPATQVLRRTPLLHGLCNAEVGLAV